MWYLNIGSSKSKMSWAFVSVFITGYWIGYICNKQSFCRGGTKWPSVGLRWASTRPQLPSLLLFLLLPSLRIDVGPQCPAIAQNGQSPAPLSPQTLTCSTAQEKTPAAKDSWNSLGPWTRSNGSLGWSWPWVLGYWPLIHMLKEIFLC